MIGKFVKFNRDTTGSVPQMMDGIQMSRVRFHIDNGSLGIVVCNTELHSGIDKYLYDVLVDDRLVSEIWHKSLTVLSEGECL